MCIDKSNRRATQIFRIEYIQCWKRRELRIFNVENVLGEMYIDKATFPHLKSQNNMHQFNPHLTHKSIGPVQIKAPDGVHWSVPNSFNSMFFQTRTSCRIFGIGRRVKTALLILHTRWRKYILKFLRTNHEKGRSDIFRRNSCFLKVEWKVESFIQSSRRKVKVKSGK